MVNLGNSQYNVNIYKFFILALLPLCLLEVAHAEQLVEAVDELVVVIPHDYPPYYILNENDQPDGFAIKVFEAVALRAGLRYRYEIKQNWTDVCNALKDGSADIIPILGQTLKREEFALFTSAVETFPVSIFVRDSNVDIHKLGDLNNQKVAVVQDECGHQLLTGKKKISLSIFNSFQIAFHSLISGQVDAMVYPQTVMLNIVNEYGLSDKIRVIKPPLVEIKRGIAVQKSALQLRQKLELSLLAFITSEQYKQIYRDWFVHEKPFWDVEKVFWSMAVLMIFLIAIFLIFRQRELMALNASLQQQIDDATNQLSQSNDYLRDLTVTDTLTGISNRRAFENSLQELMSQAHRYKNNFSMLIFDIDDFKRLNDEYGHDMGDRVLKELVDRINEIVRDVDVLSRWGGEEFTILMLQTDQVGALRMAERCRQIVADTLFDEVGPVTISLGVTEYLPDDNERKFFKRADDALYQAKAEGKNRVVWIGK